MFISTFLFLSVFYFYCYYVLLPDISTMFVLVTREQCEISAMFIFTSVLIFELHSVPTLLLCVTKEPPPHTVLQEVQSVSWLSLPLVRSHLGTYDGLAPYLVRGVV